MNSFSIHPFVLAVAVVCAVAACATPKAPSPPVDSGVESAAHVAAERDSVQAMLNDFTAKMNAGDLEGAGKLYSNDSLFSWIENGSFVYRNASDVRASLMTLKNIPRIQLKYYETHIDVLAPGVASVRTEFSQAFLDKQGKGNTYGGYLTTTAVHEKDGWRMRNGHTSSRKPRPGL
jgi:ketosteroid isomerase-like protein